MDRPRKKGNRKDSFFVPINDEIRYYEARVIYKERSDGVSENDFNKVMRVSDAKRIARDLELDLIEINGKTDPPILRIYDYTKYVWERKKAVKNNNVEVKEVQLSANISTHDMETKAKQTAKFLEKGKRVKVVLSLRGRELSRREEFSKSFYEFLCMLEDCAAYESEPKEEGNKTIVFLKKKKK